MLIKDMTTGSIISQRFVVTECGIRKTAKNADYLALTLFDGEQTIEGRLWNFNRANILPELNSIHNVKGSVSEYQGKKQITLTYIEISESQDKSEFCLCYCSLEEANKLWKSIYSKIYSIQHPVLRDIVCAIYAKYGTQLFNATSAKDVHHVGLYGNMAHTLEVADIADAICTHYHVLCTAVPISRDLTIAGALLHDIGKALIYDNDGPSITYNIDGMLLDHIAMGANMLASIRSEFPPEANGCFELLEHIILSHHGNLEYGSPVTPCFMEATIVNMADGVSASLNTLIQANNRATDEGKQFTDKIWTLDNKKHVLQSYVATILTEALNGDAENVNAAQ